VSAPVRPPRKAPVARPISPPHSQGDDDISNEDIDLPGEDDDTEAVEDDEFISNECLNITAPYVDDDEVPPSNEDVDRNGTGGQNVTAIPPFDDDETIPRAMTIQKLCNISSTSNRIDERLTVYWGRLAQVNSLRRMIL
jgi:hypothetical protein